MLGTAFFVKELVMAYYKVRIEVWCDWNPAESDLEEIVQNVVALGNHQDCIRLVNLETGSGHAVCADQSAQLSGVSWSADGNGWFVTDSSVRKAAILYISSDGQVSQLWTTSTAVGAPLASPDGTGLAFTVSSYNTNAWMIEDF